MKAQTFFITALLVTIIIIGAKSQSGPFLSQNCDDIGAEFESAKRSVENMKPSEFSGGIELLSDSFQRKRLNLDAVYVVCENDTVVGNFMTDGGNFIIGSEEYYIFPMSERKISGNICEISRENVSLEPSAGEYCIFMNISGPESFISDSFCGKVL